MSHPSDHPVEANVIGVGGGVMLLVLVDDLIGRILRRALGIGVRTIWHDILQ